MGSESRRVPPQLAGRDATCPGLRVLRDPYGPCPLSHSPQPAYRCSQSDLCAPGPAGAGKQAGTKHSLLHVFVDTGGQVNAFHCSFRWHVLLR